MQNIVLLHNHYDQEKLDAVIGIMETMGPPTIRVYDLGFDNLVQAVEGCHRLRACEHLGIQPILEYIDADAKISGLCLDDGNGAETVAELGDWENYTITEDDLCH